MGNFFLFIYFGSISLILILLNLLVAFNPDYLSYYLTYLYSPHQFNIVSCGVIFCNHFYFILNFVISHFISFETFRWILLALPIFFFFKIFKSHLQERKIFKQYLFNYLILLLLIIGIVFEYFSIRYRAGLSILSFWLALSYLISNKKIFFFYLYLFISLILHHLTFAILSIFTFAWWVNKKPHLAKYIMTAIIFTIFLMIANYLSSFRGEVLYSPLNFYRIIFNYLLPIFIYFIFFLNFILLQQKKIILHELEIILLIFLSILSILGLLNFFVISGEAIVRMSSALSALCLWFIAIKPHQYHFSSVVITFPLFNVLFFFNTIFGKYLYNLFFS